MERKDYKLWLELIKGDPGAFREFYRKTQKQLLMTARKKTVAEKDAEEVVQDTYLSFLDSLPVYKGEGSLKTWLWSIFRHEIADYWRKRYAKKVIRTVPFMDQVYKERIYSAKKTAELIEIVYKRLKPWEEKVLRWKYEEGWSVARIAEEMSWSVKAAESRLWRARRAFQFAYSELKGY